MRKLQRQLTHREFRTWVAFLESEWNRPSRSDFYLMQIAREIRGIRAIIVGKQLREKTWAAYKIEFELGRKSKANKPKMTREEAAKAAISRWAGFLGIGRKV